MPLMKWRSILTYSGFTSDHMRRLGKALAHNLTLLPHLPELSPEGLPVLAGISRKSRFGTISGCAVEDRLSASLAAALLAAQRQ